MTFIAALRVDRIGALWLLDGPFSGETFLAYVTPALVRTLSATDIVFPCLRGWTSKAKTPLLDLLKQAALANKHDKLFKLVSGEDNGRHVAESGDDLTLDVLHGPWR